MSRNYGLMIIPGGMEVQFAASLDSRSIFSTFAGLTAADAFVSTDGYSYCHVGMICTVTDDSDFGTYMLTALPTTEAANWSRLMRSTVDSLFDYETQIKNKPTINNVELTEDLSIGDLGFSFLTAEIVDVLPDLDDAKQNVVYLAPPAEPLDDHPNAYEEWLLQIDADGVRSYEYIGIAQQDLSDYYTKEEVDVLVAFINDDTASYTGYGEIEAGEALNGVTMQDLIEKLFFAVIEPTVVEPSYSVEVGNLPTALMFTEEYALETTATVDDGSITMNDTLVSTRATGHDYPTDVTITAPEEGESVEVDLSCTFAAATDDVLKSDGSVSDVYSAYAGETVTVTHTIPLIGKIYKNGEMLSGVDFNLEEGYIELTAALGDVFVFDYDFYQGIAGVQMVNGFTDEFEYIGGTMLGSLMYINWASDAEANTITVTNEIDGAILRFYVGEIDWYIVTEGEDYAIISLTDEAKAVVNTNQITTMPALPEVDGDISLEYMFADMTMSNVDISAFDFTNVVSVESMFENCVYLETVTTVETAESTDEGGTE